MGFDEVISIEVDGQSYDGWTKASCSRSMDDMAGKFSLSTGYDPLTQDIKSIPLFKKGAKCTVKVNGILFLTGEVEKAPFSFDKSSYEINIEGRSKTKGLIKSSAKHKTGQFNKRKGTDIAKEIGERLGVDVKLQGNGEYKELERYIIADGEKASQSIQHLAKIYGLACFDNENGELILTNETDGQGVDLYITPEAGNIISASGEITIEDETQEYEAYGSSIPTDKKYGKDAVAIATKAVDKTINEYSRRRVQIRGDVDLETLKKRVVHEARRAESDKNELTLKTNNLTPSGDIFKPNVKHNVSIWFRPDLDGQYILKSIEYSNEKGAYTASLILTKSKGYSLDEEGDGEDDFDNESLETSLSDE